MEHMIHTPVCGLGHNGIILYMLLFVCVVCFFVCFFDKNIEVKPMFGKCINFSRCPMRSVGLTRAQPIRCLTVLPRTWPNPKYSAADKTWDDAHFIYLEFNYRVSFTLYTFGRQCKSSFSTSHAIPSYFIMPFIHVLPRVGDFVMLLIFPWKNCIRCIRPQVNENVCLWLFYCLSLSV